MRPEERGPVYSQIDVCWADDEEEALDTVDRVWRTAGVPGQLSQDLPTPAHFDMAASIVRRDDLADEVIVGADADRLVKEAGAAIAGGVDHLYFHQIGDDQEAFCEAWRSGLAEAVRALDPPAPPTTELAGRASATTGFERAPTGNDQH